MRKILFALSMIAIKTMCVGTIYAGNIVLQTPTGLHVGDEFRFVFNTDARTQATSSDIATYDALVNNEANITNTTTYNGYSLIWQAIVSTPTVNAIDHIGATNVPLYNVKGQLVTSSVTQSGLWSGGLTHAIDWDLSGVFGTSYVWTGTSVNGSGSGAELGGDPFLGTTEGNAHRVDNVWISLNDPPQGQTNELGLYGISAIITVGAASPVPEPSSFALLGLGGIGIAIARYRRQRTAVKA